MTTEPSGMTVTAVMQSTSFLAEEVQLKNLAKLIAKANKPAVDRLILALDSKDEKIAMTAAIKLLELDIDIKKAISQDQMQRLIAEIKLNRLQPLQIPVDGDNPPPPRAVADFSTIRQF